MVSSLQAHHPLPRREAWNSPRGTLRRENTPFNERKLLAELHEIGRRYAVVCAGYRHSVKFRFCSHAHIPSRYSKCVPAFTGPMSLPTASVTEHPTTDRPRDRDTSETRRCPLVAPFPTLSFPLVVPTPTRVQLAPST